MNIINKQRNIFSANNIATKKDKNENIDKNNYKDNEIKKKESLN